MMFVSFDYSYNLYSRFFLIFFLCRYGNIGGFNVGCRRRIILGFEESRWRKEYTFSFGGVGSAANAHFQSKLGNVFENKE